MFCSLTIPCRDLGPTIKANLIKFQTEIPTGSLQKNDMIVGWLFVKIRMLNSIQIYFKTHKNPFRNEWMIDEFFPIPSPKRHSATFRDDDKEGLPRRLAGIFII